MIKAVLFDMDGVLVDAKEWHFEALNDALELVGMPISRTEHLTIYDGLPTKTKLEKLSQAYGLPRKLHKFLNEIKQRRTIEITVEKCRPHFHLEFTLSKLKKDGYRLGVCSNSIRQTVQMMMQNSSLDQYLEFQLSNEDVEHPKPHPDIYELAIRRLGLHATEVLIVEDNQHGIQAALGAGGQVMQVQTIYDVTYESIMQRINELEGVACAI